VISLAQRIHLSISLSYHYPGQLNGLGLINDGALVQEFLQGKEYVIGKVSRDGVHKLVAIWQYDKREINGASFVYFGTKLMNSSAPMFQRMVAYSTEVLDALGIKQGPSHMEVRRIWCAVVYCGVLYCVVECFNMMKCDVTL
jgi:hypothetical protein